jgi:two-component system CheB/CheR fusion protein
MNPKKPNSKAPVIKDNIDKKIGKFPIVCLGASAGGLEALEQFLGNTSPQSGMDF